MDGVQAVAQSVEAVNQVLENATNESIEHAEKMVKVGVEMSLEQGKGDLFNALA